MNMLSCCKRVSLMWVALGILGLGKLPAQVLLIHFGQSTTPALGSSQSIVEAGVTYSSSNVTTDPSNYWNNVLATGQGFLAAGTTNTTQFTSTETVSNLVTTTGTATGVNIAMGGSYYSGHFNASGVTSGGPYIGNATSSSIVGDVNDTPVITISGLNPSLTYNFTVYASRGLSLSDVRTADYAFVGATSGTGVLDAANNTSNTALVSGIAPNASGVITLTITPDATNTNATSPGKLFYLGDLQIQAVPEPASVGLVACGGLVLLGVVMRRKIMAVRS